MKTLKEKERLQLKRLGVNILYLFGSQISRRPSFNSDIDIGIVLREVSLLKNRLSIYQKLLGILEPIFKPSFEKNLDLVFLQASPFSLQFQVIREGKIIYQLDPYLRAEYEEKVLKHYLDFQPILSYFDHCRKLRYEKITT